MITTSTGTTITTEPSPAGELVILSSPDAPADLRTIEAGRFATFGDGLGFQPAPFFPGVLSAETLRGIAELLEQSR
ncbi:MULTISPECIES: hypothetical protein [unclassified Aeromicrobium]|uniref:hypothetical protein n=1 Tax=unclassified Aeromicrobium TaxID=2633570 RepID=UPI0028894858|nr:MULTISPECIES: hypothetical protein [unclassified Aeromicrobium]